MEFIFKLTYNYINVFLFILLQDLRALYQDNEEIVSDLEAKYQSTLDKMDEVCYFELYIFCFWIYTFKGDAEKKIQMRAKLYSSQFYPNEN